MTFEELEWAIRPMMGKQAVKFFSNGYGVSVIQGPYSYGGPERLYDLAVLAGTEEGWSITYTTPITDDVIGHLSPEEVTELLLRIEALPVVEVES